MNAIRDLIAEELHAAVFGDGPHSRYCLCVAEADALVADPRLRAIISRAAWSDETHAGMAFTPEIRALLADWRAS